MNKRSKAIEKRVSLLKCMNEIARSANNENIFEWWILVFPDGADDDDYIECSENDDLFDHICESFFKICDAMRKDGGIYIWEDTRAFGCRED